MDRNKIKLLQIQDSFKNTKEETLANILCHLENHKNKGEQIDIVVLYEMFNCPYDTKLFNEFAEDRRGKTYDFCQKIAKENNVYLIAGSIVEKERDKLYNTSFVFNHKGEEIARHRKIHLFDINIAGGQKFKESDTLSAGSDITVFDTPWGKMGLCICFDIRFPEIWKIMAKKGAKVIFVPANFNTTTGPMHWELLFKSRAVDNQVFTVGTSASFDERADYKAWGHSLVVDPWGKIINSLDEKRGSMLTEISLEEVDKVRNQLPLLSSMREDVYNLVER